MVSPVRGVILLKQGNALHIKTQNLNEPRSGRNISAIAPADLAEEIMKSSSWWIKTKGRISATSLGRMAMVESQTVIQVLMQFLFRPPRGLIIFVEVRHRAKPDVTISKAYGLSSFYIDS